MLHGFRIASPVGELLVAVDDRGVLRRLEFGDGRGAGRLTAELGDALASEPPAAGAKVARQLDEYFAGARRDFEIEVEPAGTEVQRQVWAALREIRFGETESYGHLAARIGNPAAVRAVGRANGDNPIAIVIPCHRVIGADGSLTGYGGGMERKRLLLDLERPQLGLF